MNARPTEWTVDNAAWKGARPKLSVLIPFMRDDPAALLKALARETVPAEIVVLDDGTGDDLLAARVAAVVEALPLPARFVRLASNEGRAKGRNRLAGHARAKRLLFLDSDMLPDGDGFLAAWLEVDAAVAFGGFSLDQTPRRPEHALHRAMALKSDCLPVETRRTAPEKHVFTSNLLVRRDVFEAIRFDETFSGWGWEDVEWAMRVAREHPILHVDIPASHLGLDTAQTLAAKYEQSAANFARVVAEHPEVVAGYASYRAAEVLKRVPLRGLWRPAVKALALSPAPLPVRDFAMRLYRAALYAEAV